MTRKKKLLMNTAAGLLKQGITVVCGFILPRYMLLYYGSSINGLISSITHYLGFISFLDMGVGSVIYANFYKPLAEQDDHQISLIVKSSNRFFHRLAYIFLAYIAVLCFVFPTAINNDHDVFFTVSLLLILSISTVAQYLFGMTNQLLLNADQKAFIPLALQIGTVILNTVLSVILMKLGFGVHIVKLTTAAVFILRPLGQTWYVKRHYKIDRTVKMEGEPIKQKWNGFAQHMAGVLCQNIDVAVLSIFSTMENVSVYSVYFNITNGAQQVIMTAATGLESLFGNLFAKGEKEKLSQMFEAVELAVHFAVSAIFTIAGITILPFVSVYTKGIQDANYLLPLFGYLLVLAYGVQCLRIPYFRIIKAAGHFKQTQTGAFISAGLNLVITVALVFKYGLIGAAIGTLVAMLYHTCYFVWYLRKNIINRPIRYFIYLFLYDCVVFGLSYFVTKPFVMADTTYFAWIIYAVKVSLCVGLISLVFGFLGFSKRIKAAFLLLRSGENKAK